MSRGLGKHERYILEHATEEWTYLGRMFLKWMDKQPWANYPPEPENWELYDDFPYGWEGHVRALRWRAFRRAARSLERKGLIKRRHCEEFVTFPAPGRATFPMRGGATPYWNRRSVQVKRL